MFINFEKQFELDLTKLNNPVILIGWPGIALVGKLAITSIKESLDAKLFLNITFFDFPPKSSVDSGSLEIPTAKLYYAPRKSGDLFFLTGDYQPQSPEGVFEFSNEFCKKMDELTNSKIKMYISTGAMVSDKSLDSKESTIYICGTHPNEVDQFLKYDHTKLMETGVIAGANGILPAWAGQNKFAPGICLLAETVPLRMINLDPKASKALVRILKNHFKIDMDFSELDKKVEEMEEMLDKFKEQANHFMKEQREDETGVDSYFR